jgi:hypothetical protein
MHAAIDEAVNALQAAVLLAAQIDRAGRDLAALTPKKDEDARPLIWRPQ